MHIPDGFLTTRIALSLDVISAATVVFAARRVKIDLAGRTVPLMGVLAAFVFAAQMLNFPIIGGTSGHLIGGSLLAILLGPMVGFLTLTTVVIAQALFLQDGGLIALGANIFNIAGVTCFSGYAVFRLAGGAGKGNDKRLPVAGFLSGWASSVISAVFCAIQLGLSGAIPMRIGVPAMAGYHVIVGLIEGLLTAGVLTFLKKVRPDLLKENSAGRFGVADWAGAVLFIAVPAVILFLAGSSALPDPMEKMLTSSHLFEAETEAAGASATFMDFMIRGAVFLVLIGLIFMVGFLSRRRSRT